MITTKTLDRNCTRKYARAITCIEYIHKEYTDKLEIKKLYKQPDDSFFIMTLGLFTENIAKL